MELLLLLVIVDHQNWEDIIVTVNLCFLSTLVHFKKNQIIEIKVLSNRERLDGTEETILVVTLLVEYFHFTGFLCRVVDSRYSPVGMLIIWTDSQSPNRNVRIRSVFLTLRSAVGGGVVMVQKLG